MARKRLTELCPALLPLRQWQRKRLFYLKMRLDGRRYAVDVLEAPLPQEVFAASSRLLNEHSGFDMRYQYNKVHNLKLAAKSLHHRLIRPGETFSFWQCARNADRQEPYKDGLVLVNGEIVGAYGGGLCQISNLLFWLFLHTPLTMVERHGHRVEDFPGTTVDQPAGTDATIHEGWLDLKVKNDTPCTFQLDIRFDDQFLHGRILSDQELPVTYEVFNDEVTYYREGNKVFRSVSVDRRQIDRKTGGVQTLHLYDTVCEIGYALPADTLIVDKGDAL